MPRLLGTRSGRLRRQRRFASAPTFSRLHRVRGVLLLHLRGGADPEAEASLQQALAVAREQDAKGWEIGAATDLARLWAGQSRRAEAQALLASIYGRFTEGFDMPILQEAKALLDQLA